MNRHELMEELPLSLRYQIKFLKTMWHKGLNNSKIVKQISDDYLTRVGSILHWDNPTTYTEKMCFAKLYNATPEKTILTDKIAVREWVKNKVGEKYLIPLLGIYDKFEDIDFSSLPKAFVMKCSHDSGSVRCIDDSTQIDYKKLKTEYHYFLKRNWAYVDFEMHYKDIPHKILIEKKMSNKGEDLRDYKFLCFGGQVKYCWVDFNRFDHHKRNIYDLEWNLQPFTYTYENFLQPMNKPKCFEEMIRIVSILCKGFDHVRVDLYDIDDRPYFGEMTFTSGGGYGRVIPNEYDYELGKFWTLDLNKI